MASPVPPTPPTRGSFQNLDGGAAFAVTLNPTSMKLKRKAKWSEDTAAGQQYSTLQFSGGEMDSLDLQLLLDTSETGGSVLTSVQTLYGWTVPIAAVGRPPVVLFTWGAFTFQGVVEEVEADFQLFDSAGAPKRAMATLSMVGKAFAKGGSSAQFFAQAAPTTTTSSIT